jgi:hypothetical protein
VNIETVIYMAVKICVAVKPRAGADEDATGKPFRTVVAIGSAGIRGVVIVAVRAPGFGADGNGDLSLYFGRHRGKTNSGNCSSQSKTFEPIHEFLLAFVKTKLMKESMYVRRIAP